MSKAEDVSENPYCVLTNGPDGFRVNFYDKEDLELRLAEGEIGPVSAWIPNESDPNYWGSTAVILEVKRLVVPKPVEVVKKWEV